MNSKRDDAAGGPVEPPQPRREIDGESAEAGEVSGQMTANENTAFASGDPSRIRAAGARTHTDPARLAEIRQRILDGAYNSLETVEQVARRILASGDL